MYAKVTGCTGTLKIVKSATNTYAAMSAIVSGSDFGSTNSVTTSSYTLFTATFTVTSTESRYIGIILSSAGCTGLGGAAATMYIDDITIQGPCTTPASQPTVFVAGASGASTLSASFTPPFSVPQGYLIVRTTTNTQPSNPVSGTTYSVGASALGGIIDNAGPASSFTSAGLLPSTQY